ncbi:MULTISPECIES: Gldg family protein [unclassified Bradyrhizobium]|uniref:Gldg family protein n=1 Tax=unclassified Bradyrhizobium TaxID=2631580 RepID=UPI00247ADB76|nr:MULTISPECIES: Gldg family protein [unclassified Bradyrhizobium]WGR73458.1 GldG family protein [Bradyrhizobium sp. ISRA426]WGR78295.1 GldG family protein [Bradyrhizobium sp. ISRA430]WGR88696.1 GldG family protein [Bradyrhizobium sp. ISRA432]
MSGSARSNIALLVLAAGAIASGAIGFAGFGETASNSLLFAACFLALLALFMLAIRLPLRGGGLRWSAWFANASIVVAAVVAVIGANVALYRHDVHFDVSREGRNTPPQQLIDVIAQLRTPLALTYFYNASDANAISVRDLVQTAARNHPLLAFRAIDLDKEPGLARDLGVRAYNTAVLQAEDRKVLVENVIDPARIGYAALSVLRKRVETVCFVTGHGETFRPLPSHFHFSHVETLKGHETPGAGDVLETAPEALDRLLLALNQIGFEMRELVTVTATSIPPDCSVVADIGPRTAFTVDEAVLLGDYVKGGGRLLLLIDPLSEIGGDLERLLLKPVGLSSEAAIVIDPLNHFRTDADKVAVPYYPPHPITKRLALTVFPQARPIAVSRPPSGVSLVVLAASSQDSYLRSPKAAATTGGDPPNAQRSAQPLAVALEGSWPGASPSKRFRLVVAGTSKVASNEYFPYVSNGELSLAMLRWLAEDDATPSVAPQTFKLPEIVLTSSQMRDTFIVLEVLLPLSTALFGVAMWWRRR